MTVVVWFRRDLRLADSGVLTRAAALGEPVVPLFVLDPRILATAGERRQQRLYGSLAALADGIREQGGSGLLTVHGDPRAVVPQVAREHGAAAVLVTEDFAPYGRQRDAEVEQRLRAEGRRLVAADTPYLHRPATVAKADGSPYAVFTPFFRAWRAQPVPPPLQPAPVRFAGIEVPPLPGTPVVAAGEQRAEHELREFVRHRMDGYGADRNRPDLAGTSGLSPALHFGELHPRTVVAAVAAAEVAGDAYLRQLCWREFYADVLFHRPHLATRSLDPRWDRFPWRSDDAALRDFRAWCEGRTGYPFVDAGMRQLRQDGWMHNRARMVSASFLTKDLQVPWQWGARWFATHLLDADVANNSLGWQWVAGTGVDPAPFHRVFNPVTQGLRFDPDGVYVHRYVPELRGIPGGMVHEPWERNGAAPSYPARIVDHAAARAEALAAYEAITGR